VVVGADGMNSSVARAGNAQQYHEKPRLLAAYYTYFSGVPTHNRFETYIRPHRGIAAWPTNDDLTLVIAGWPYAEFAANKKDVEGNFVKTLDLVPEFADRVRRGRREDRFYGTAVPNFFRKPFGDGWALVGDAGYNKDFITAQGISDAFRDAELCANALDGVLSGGRDFDEAMSEYQTTRDRHALPMYEFTAQLATLEPPPPELQKILGAVHGNREAMDGFVRVNSGVTSPAEFFSEENVHWIFETAQ
jgi:2-polyprenyl-6-methoxyphenol hydroxylase-like FAD-dependent oxidoreductase